MARKSKIHYDPTKSIEENARLNNVTKDGIYYYLRTNGIERKEDRLDNLIAEITKAIEANPTASQAEIARITGRSTTTVNKYWKTCKGEEATPKISRNKFPKTDISRLGISPKVFDVITTIEDFTPTIADPYRINGLSGIQTIQDNIFESDYPKRKYDVVTIPSPANNLPDIILQCLKVCKNKVALLLPIRYITDQAIYGIVLKKHPLYRLYIMPDSNYAWYVWQKDFKGETEMKWLTAQPTKTITKTQSAKPKKSIEISTNTNTINMKNQDRIYGIIGAIIGDIAGSRFESMPIFPKKNFKMFGASCTFTDDTVMTIAVADAILHEKPFSKSLWKWGNLYPNAGYGGLFRKWLKGSFETQYESFGNGSAMRISAVGFHCQSLEDVLKIAKEATIPTHNSEEGIKGAQAIASATYLARTGKAKNDIKAYIEAQFGYNLNLTFDDIKQLVLNKEGSSALAAKSVPVAIIAFLNGNDYEDVVRTAISYGGDTDTIGCMAGSIAAAFYGVPIELAEQAALYLPKDLLDIINEFDGSSLSNHRITPPTLKRWKAADTIVVYGCNSDESDGEKGYPETRAASYYNRYPKKGYPIHTIGTSIEIVKKEIHTLIDHIKANPTSTYIIENVGISEKSGYSIEAIAPLFKPLMNLDNVYMIAEFWDYLLNNPTA